MSDAARGRLRLLGRVAVVAFTLVSLVVAARLRLASDLTSLFPRGAEAEALARVTRAFGNGDVTLLLVRASEPEVAERAADLAADELRALPVVETVLTEAPPAVTALDPTEAWRFAGPRARARLAKLLTEEGMRERLRETRALLLAPGAGDAAEMLARDPLRLSLVPWEDRIEVAAGARGRAGDGFVGDEGRARIVVVEAKGRAFDPGAAAAFTIAAEAALARARAREPGARFDLAGGHVVAFETEALIRRDLTRSGALSIGLAALAFAVTFRRVRALVAVLPPLLAGTLWTTALAATFYPRLSAIATAFAAVVVGVGVDTGVHVYARLLAARRDGRSPESAAHVALAETWRPTLGAAAAAGGAFGCLALSDIEGMRQLGLLCAAGEVLTAVAILLVVPEIGARLERGAPPPALRASFIASLTRTKARAAAAVAVTGALLVAALVIGLPKIDHAVVALRPSALPSLETYAAIDRLFGTARGQLVVVSTDRDPERARAGSDAIVEALDAEAALGGRLLGFDALGRLAPSPMLQRSRLAARDRLRLPEKAALLERLLAEEGFSPEAFRPAIEALEQPATRTADVLDDAARELGWLRRRHLAVDAGGGLAVTYVRLAPGASEGEVRALIHGADPAAIVTGYPALERGLVESLAHDLPRVLLGALGIAVVLLGATLRRPSRVAIAVLVLAVELALVVVFARFLGVRWHVYDALVLPVLLGITLDEVLFLLEAADRSGSIDEAIAEQAPLGVATALTTAAGFGALVVCRFDGLADVGKVGALGSTVGLLVALVVVPAFHRLLPSVLPRR